MIQTRTFNITCDGVTMNSLTDYGLAVGNTNYIGEPTMEEFYVDVPGGGVIDLSDALTGRPVFKQRTISIEVGAMRYKDDWDREMSIFRNRYDGKVCKITFDNDQEWYWEGRVRITNFERTKSLGTFTIVMTANPYKQKVIPIIDSYDLSGVPKEVDMHSFDIPTEPVFVARDNGMSVATWKQGMGQTMYTLVKDEEFKIPALLTDTDYKVTVDGSGTVDVYFKEKSL